MGAKGGQSNDQKYNISQDGSSLPIDMSKVSTKD